MGGAHDRDACECLLKSTAAVTNWELGSPKLLGLLLGAITILGIINTVTSVSALSWAILDLSGATLTLLWRDFW